LALQAGYSGRQGDLGLPWFKYVRTVGRMIKMQLTKFHVDDSAHNRDGMVLHACYGDQKVTAFISRRVMDDWASQGRERSLLREQYNALGKRNLPAIERIVTSKYQRGASFNRQHPFIDVLLADITESGEVLDISELVRVPVSPGFQRM